MDKIMRGKEKYIESSMRLGMVKEVAERRAKEWEKAQRAMKKQRRKNS